MSIDKIATELFAAKPTKTLFHYTSLGALRGIVDEGGLFATDIHYFNDAAELRHFMHLLHGEIDQRLQQHSVHEKALRQFKEWTSYRIPDGNMVFVTSFTENGNLLSQWRGYCAIGKGISLGLNPVLLERCSQTQQFHVGKCIYTSPEQHLIVRRVVDSIVRITEERGEAGPHEKHPTQSFHKVFEEIESTLLRIAALIKHPSFSEEEEWRAVSPVLTNYVTAPINYREGVSMLVPYIVLSLNDATNSPLQFDHVFLGPTPNVKLSINSVSRSLAKRQVAVTKLEYCGIPFRAW